MLVSGKTMFTMARGKRSGRMALYLRVCMPTAKRMVLEFINGRIRPFTKAIGSTTRWRVKELTRGMMAEFTRGNGWITTWTGSACISGRTGAAMRANTQRIWGMGPGHSHGVMDASIRGRGRKGKCMVKEFTRMCRVLRHRVCGLRETGQISCYSTKIRID